MKWQKKSKSVEMSRKANTMIRRRVLMLMAVFGVATFLALFIKLFQIQIVDYEFYVAKAVEGQTRDLPVSANRGKILDAKGNPLAMSASVSNVVLSPKEIIDKDMDQGLIATGLSNILYEFDIEVDREAILKRMVDATRQYEVIAYKVEDDVSDAIRAFIVDNKLTGGVYLEPDSKRYYPSNNLAAQVVGFVNSENSGAYGLEAIYEENLAGEKGRVVTTKSASGVDLLSGYETYIDAVDGYNLHLTIDSNIQRFAYRTLEEGIEKFEAQEGGFCIVMDPKTGAILAMVSLPDYDLNEPSAIRNAQTAAQLEAMKENPDVSDAEYSAAVSNARLSQWRNKAVNDLYEPGSTFKPIVVAMGLEEGKISEYSTFYCSGSITVPGWPNPIHCHYHRGHGSQDLRKALMNSCNPALITIGQSIGNETFYSYMNDFGLLSVTGIDLQGEGKGNFWAESAFQYDIVSLATASFGQRFQVTPIGLITALSAVINGGHLVEPYVVQSVTDSDGNVVDYHEHTEVRQVISQETSDLVRDMMKSVVETGTGKNASVEGYSIGGKTGTSETTYSDDRLIVSFVGFAPVEDPQVIVLLAYDYPKPTSSGSNYTSGGYYISGGNMAAPMAGQLIADILDYMGVQKLDSQVTRDVPVASYVNLSADTAKTRVSNAGLTYKVVGTGDTVTDQTPASGASIPSGSTVVLYLGTDKTTDKVEVPDVTGRSYSSVKSMLESRGLYLKAAGVESASGVMAFNQSVAAGTLVDPGTVIEVRFTDTSIQD